MNPASSAPATETVREVESPTHIFRNIKKQPGAPYVAGLEPERFGPLATMGEFRGADGKPASESDVIYESSVSGSGYLLILAAIAFVAVWYLVYYLEVPDAPKSYGNGAPPVQGKWAAIELGLDKIRVLENLKLFPITTSASSLSAPAGADMAQEEGADGGNSAAAISNTTGNSTTGGFLLTQWLQHRVATQLFAHLIAVVAISTAALKIARAVPIFSLFCVPGCAVLSLMAVLGDTYLLTSALSCFQTAALNSSSSTTDQTLVVKGAGCKLPLMMHVVCVHMKWTCLAFATTLIVIPLRFRGGLSGGMFRWLNLTAISCLPAVANALRIYLWYSGLDLPAQAVAQHGWMLTHQEDILNVSLMACIWTQAVAWVLLGIALIQQGTLVVLEQNTEPEPQLLRRKDTLKTGEEENKDQDVPLAKSAQEKKNE